MAEGKEIENGKRERFRLGRKADNPGGRNLRQKLYQTSVGLIYSYVDSLSYHFLMPKFL